MNNSDIRAFAEFYEKCMSLDALKRVTSALDEKLENSQRVIADMKKMFESVSNSQSVPSEVNLEDAFRFLEADPPKLLKPDMKESDLKDIISLVKKRAEELEKNVKSIVEPDVKTSAGQTQQELQQLMDQYLINLETLKHLNTKLTERAQSGLTCPELQKKLTQLCHDINTFTKATEANAAISEWNNNRKEIQPDSNKALIYSEQVSKLLANIVAAAYLLQEK